VTLSRELAELYRKTPPDVYQLGHQENEYYTIHINIHLLVIHLLISSSKQTSDMLTFLSLPAEIRHEIYKTCISSIYFRDLNQVLPLAQTNRLIYAESSPVFDNHNLTFPTINTLYSFLLSIRRERRRTIRQISFHYYPKSGQTRGQLKWDDMELARRAFRLLGRECIRLATLTIHINEIDIKHDFNLFWVHYPSFRDLFTCSVETTTGLPELLRVRGLKSVVFLPTEEEESFSAEARKIFNDCQMRMTRPRPAKQKRLSRRR
jgi:hypothetical protein